VFGPSIRCAPQEVNSLAAISAEECAVEEVETRPTRGGTSTAAAVEKAPSGSPFLDQFSRYFPDLRARPINAGHFFIKEAPEPTNRFLQSS